MNDDTGVITWLQAQLDEDERMAQGAARTDDGRGGHWTTPGLQSAYDARVDEHIARHDPARVLVEVEAKRQLIDQILGYEAKIDGEWGCSHSAEQIGRGECPDHLPADTNALRTLALPYADQPGWREEWRPAEESPL